jgi:hypothetical protein
VGAPEEGFWGATGNLGNLARAASISSLLIIALVAALTCLGAIPIIYLWHSITLSSRSRFLLEQVSPPDPGVLQASLEQVSPQVCTGNWERVGGGGGWSEVSQRITQIRNTDFPATPSKPEPSKMHPDQKALELPWKVGRRPSRGQGPSHLGRASYLRDCCCCCW